MDRENIENQQPAQSSPASEPACIGQTVEVPPPSPTTNNPALQPTKLRVNIRSWSGVAVWKWLANDDTCGICRVAFDGCCPDCKFAGDDCPLVWGQCSHCFHIHCIMKWLGTQQTQHQCPMCRQEWKFKE